MIDAIAATKNEIRTAYDRRSGAYERVVAPLHRRAHEIAIEALRLQPDDQVLDVAVGPGLSTIEIARRVNSHTFVHAVDLSPRMLGRAKSRARSSGVENVVFAEADASRLPFPDDRFDALYNAYMLDLIPLAEMPAVLAEFRRVLKPGGRLVLLNMSKERDERAGLREIFYRALPSKLVLYLGGGCRPVLMAGEVAKEGFVDVRRQFLAERFASEIVTARKA